MPTPSITAEVAGALFGPKAHAIINVMEALGREKYRSIHGGFVHDIFYATSMLASDVNPIIADLLAAGLIQRRGKAMVEVVVITSCQLKQASLPREFDFMIHAA